MAELYARQGLIDEAEAIYRELLRDRPDDATLRDGLDAVLGMRAARGAARAPDVRPEVDVGAPEVVELDSPASEPEPAGAEAAEPEPIPAAEELIDLLRAGEALVDRLPEPPLESPETLDEPASERPVLEEWLRGLRG
jgi:hypothetical protein